MLKKGVLDVIEFYVGQNGLSTLCCAGVVGVRGACSGMAIGW